MENKIVWVGVVDDKRVRIVQTDKDDAYVEEQKASWIASSDETASRAFMAAFLETLK